MQKEVSRGIELVIEPEVIVEEELTNLSKSKIEFSIDFLMELLDCKTTKALDIREEEGVLISRSLDSSKKPKWFRLIPLERFKVTSNGLDKLIEDLLTLVDKNKWEKVQDLPYLYINTGEFQIRLVQKYNINLYKMYQSNRLLRVKRG